MPELVEKSKSAIRFLPASDHAPIFCRDQASFAPKLSIVWCLIPESRTNVTLADASTVRTNDGNKIVPAMNPLKFISTMRRPHKLGNFLCVRRLHPGVGRSGSPKLSATGQGSRPIGVDD